MSCVVGFSALMSIFGVVANRYHRKRKAARELKINGNDEDNNELQVLTTVKRRYPRE